VVGEVAPHDGAGADHRVPAEARARQDDRAGAQPRARADLDGVLGGPLPPDRGVGIGVDVVLVGHVAVRSGDHVVADDDRAVGDEVAPAPDEAALADPQHR
jgi:hypothetical protein